MLDIPMFRQHVQFDKGTRTSPDRAWKYEHLQPALKALGLACRPAGDGGSGEARTSDFLIFYALFNVYTTFQL